MIILGIDPGSRITGYGIIRFEKNQSKYLDSGCIRMADLPLPERLNQIYQGITDIISHFPLDEAAIEQVFMHRNADSALKLGHARGAAMVGVVSRALPIAEYSARQIKQAVVGKGSADKSQVAHMVKILLNISKTMSPDESDALAVALCHGHTQHSLARLAGAQGIARGRLR